MNPSLDVDVFIGFRAEAGHLRTALTAIFEYLTKRGAAVEEYLVIAGWPVQLAMRPDVSFAFSHGSFVSGHDGFRDIDVAVWLAPGADRFTDVSLATELSRIVDLPVDVRIANAAPVAFLFHVLRGRLLAVRDESLLAEVMERTARQYHDQAPLVRLATRDAFAACTLDLDVGN